MLGRRCLAVTMSGMGRSATTFFPLASSAPRALRRHQMQLAPRGTSATASIPLPRAAMAMMPGAACSTMLAAPAASVTMSMQIVSTRRAMCTSSRKLLEKKTPAADAAPEAAGEKAASAGEKGPSQLAGFNPLTGWKKKEEPGGDGEEEAGADKPEEGYLPFPPPFHTINIMSLLLIGNVLCYMIMNFCGNDDVRDFVVEHMTLSHENAWRVYPLLTHAFYQEHLLQLAIDSWLLFQFGSTMMGFLGGKRLAVFWAMTALVGGGLHLGRQQVELYIGMDPLEVRGRCFGPNPFILGLVGVEGLIFRNMNFLQSPPVPFLVLTAFVMVLDVWRIFTTKPEEHGAPTGGALAAYLFWVLPTRRMGLDKLTAAV
jgi:membrane associated rhomboid family serine protease